MYRRLAHSLVTRLILLGMVLITLGAVFRLYVVMPKLRDDIRELVSSQQLSIASYIARDIDAKITQRRGLIERLAKEIPPALLTRPAPLAAWLEERQRLYPLFSNGLLLIPADGQGLLAQAPDLPSRKRLDFTVNDWFAKAVASPGVIVGSPFRGRIQSQPLLIMSVAVRDAQGRVQAVLAGVSRLDDPGFLDLLQAARLGSNGGFLVVSPADKLFVAASDPSMVLQPTPASGVNALHDQAMNGFRGTGITVNARGVEELSAIATVPATGWFVVARIPTSEAFQPAERIRGVVVRYSLAVFGVILILLLIILPRIFRPLAVAAREMRAMAEGRRDLSPLPIVRHDEVGDMTAGFNALLARLRENEAKLRESEAHMAHMAHHDPLTGLPNRLLLEDRMEQAVVRAERSGTCLAMLFLDLDGFKPINDLYGHEIGDAVLREVAQRLLAERRRTDTVARLGGDEFVILLTDAEPELVDTLAREVAQACIERISRPCTVGKLRLEVGVSIGIALYSALDATPHGHLLNRADLAMYAAKQGGRGRYEFFRPDMIPTP